MTILQGHFDGRHVVLDEPVPPEFQTPTPVQVVFGQNDAREVLAEIAKLARPTGLPPDYSQQPEHYVKGTPRR